MCVGNGSWPTENLLDTTDMTPVKSGPNFDNFPSEDVIVTTSKGRRIKVRVDLPNINAPSYGYNPDSDPDPNTELRLQTLAQ